MHANVVHHMLWFTIIFNGEDNNPINLSIGEIGRYRGKESNEMRKHDNLASQLCTP